MSFCTNCGAQVLDPAKFCPNCGTPARTVTEPQVNSEDKLQITKPMVFGAVGIIAMIFVALGSVLPWATVSASIFSASKNGLSGDGVITIVLAFLGLGFFVVGIARDKRWPFVVGLALSVLISAASIFDAADITRVGVSAKSGATVTIGVGLVLCIIGGVIGVVSGFGGEGMISRSSGAPLPPMPGQFPVPPQAP